MKKLLAMLFCLVLLCACLPVVAEDPAVVTTAVSAATLRRGDTLTVTVKVENSPAVDALAITMGDMWDDNVFELVSARWLLTGGMISDVDTAKRNAVIMFSKACSFDGDVFEVTLKVKDTSGIGHSVLTAGAVFGSAAANIPVALFSCEVEIVCNHSWKGADCTYPETCTLCGTTQGKALGHAYEEDTCSRCGVSKEVAATTTTTTVPTKVISTTARLDGTTTAGKQPTATEKSTYTTVIVGGITTTAPTEGSATRPTGTTAVEDGSSTTGQTGGSDSAIQTVPTQDAFTDPLVDTTDRQVFILLCVAVAVAIGGCVIGVLVFKKKKNE